MTNDWNIGDGPVEAVYKRTMEGVARALDEAFNGIPAPGKQRQTGFVLLVFPFGEKEGRCNYISNGADRVDIAALLREQLARFEGRVGDGGTG
jgi:hypothetical protein